MPAEVNLGRRDHSGVTCGEMSAEPCYSYSGPSLSPTGNSVKSTVRVSCARLQAAGKPGAGDLPIAFHRDNRDSQHLGHFVFLKSAEESQLHHSGCPRIGPCELRERLIQEQHVFVVRDRIPAVDGAQADLLLLAATLAGDSCPGMIDEDPPHRLGGDGKEMRAVLIRHRFAAHQPNPEFIDERMRVERVTAAFMAKEPGRDLP